MRLNSVNYFLFSTTSVQFLPDDASIEEREDEVEGDRTPRYKMVHPRPEMSL